MNYNAYLCFPMVLDDPCERVIQVPKGYWWPSTLLVTHPCYLVWESESMVTPAVKHFTLGELQREIYTSAMCRFLSSDPCHAVCNA